MPGGNLEHLADEAFGSPVSHGDQATGAAHAFEFRSDYFGAGGEHGSKHGKHYVEVGGGVGKIFGVSLSEFDFQVLRFGALASLLQQVGSEVETGDLRAGASGGDRLIAGAAGDIQYFHAGL